MEFTDVIGRNIRCSEERIRHIDTAHPEMHGQLANIEMTLLTPDIITKSITDEEVALYYRYFSSTPVAAKLMCVIVKCKANDAFLITAYFTDSIKRGVILWEK